MSVDVGDVGPSAEGGLVRRMFMYLDKVWKSMPETCDDISKSTGTNKHFGLSWLGDLNKQVILGVCATTSTSYL
jgi:hypothetical protein